MGKEGYEGEILRVAFVGSELFPVDINDIAHRLKSKKADAYRERDAEGNFGRIEAEGRESRCHRVDPEVEILKKAQHPEVESDRAEEPEFASPGSFGFGDLFRQQVISCGRAPDERQKSIIPMRVKYV